MKILKAFHIVIAVTRLLTGLFFSSSISAQDISGKTNRPHRFVDYRIPH